MSDQKSSSENKVKPVQSPCVSACFLDDEDVCAGCYRTANEITDWSELTQQEKRDVLKNTRLRFKQKNKHLLL
jgi:predicted Fe-S protein YdhL (DUF1289 family)